jgi:hypothetical protein
VNFLSATPKLLKRHCRFFWCDSSQWVMASSFTRFLDQTQNDAPQLVGFLWTSYQLVAETSTWQHTTQTLNVHAAGGIQTHNLSRRAAANLRLRPRGQGDRPIGITMSKYLFILFYILSDLWTSIDPPSPSPPAPTPHRSIGKVSLVV